MRKLLLTSVCTLGALGLADIASAQTTPSTGTIGQRPGDTARGLVTTVPTPTVQISNPIQGQLIGKPGATPGANNNNNVFGTARSGASAVPTPGTLVIHFNARVLVEWAQGWSSLQDNPNGAKRTSNQIGSYIRMYGGADGMAANGLRYGGAFEVRTNFSGAALTPNAAAPASQASATTSLQTLFVRRAFIYAGTDKLGIIRVGTGDGLISLFDQGRTTFQTYSPTANFNGSTLGSAIGGNSAPAYAFISLSGDEYDSQKIVYLSPNFSGFDFGLQYSPAAGNSQAACGTVSSACTNITTSINALDGARYRDMVSGGVRYSGDIGPVNVYGYGVINQAGHVNFNGPAGGPGGARAAIGAAAGSTWNGQFDNLTFGSAGIVLTYEGFSIGGNYIGGAVNGRMAARPQGGAGTQAWLVGTQYRVPGIPLTVGAAFATIDSQGAVQMTTVSQRHEYEFSFGGSYTLAPGMVVYADYLYQNRKQSGFDFRTNTPGTQNNQVQGQGFQVGTIMTW